MKFWTKRITYIWQCAYCNRGLDTTMIDDDTEPSIGLPDGWYAVLATNAIPTTFCSLICLGKYYNR